MGQVIRTIQDAGIANNTLFILTSDNGADWKPEDAARFAHRANASWRGEKADIWDAGHRIPFIALAWQDTTRFCQRSTGLSD